MIFSLVSVALDWLTQNHEDKLTKAKDEAERKKTELEEVERKRFEGTRVTVETFMAWKMKFDAELAELKRIEDKKREAEGRGVGVGGNVSGKELFAINADLDDSDIKFLGGDDGGGGRGDDADAVGGGGGASGVEVDEALFQDMEDLDFDDDDEDFDPNNFDDDDD